MVEQDMMKMVIPYMSRTIRQYIKGCKKHHYVYFGPVPVSYTLLRRFGYKTMLRCKNCDHILYSDIDLMVVESTLDLQLARKCLHH